MPLERSGLLEEHAVSPATLRLVERLVGGGDELERGLDRRRGESRDADADRDGIPAAVVLEDARLDRVAEPFTKHASVVELHPATEDRELFATVPTEDVLLSERARRELRELHED